MPVLGCGAQQPGEELLGSLVHADVRRADGDLLFSERVMRQGWGLAERDSEGAFRWAVGGGAEVEFHSLAAAATTVVARARGAIAPGHSTQPVRVLLNDAAMADLELGAEWTDLELPVTPDRLRRGANRLTFEFGRPLTPTVGERDARPLAACFRTLRMGRPLPAPEGQGPLRIDLDSAEVAGLLGDGWSEPGGEGPDGSGWRWASAPAASLRLDLQTPADRRLVLTARRPESLATQRLEVWLNGHHLVSHDLAAKWSMFTAEAPREEWVAGSNQLVLRFGTVLVVEGESHSAQVARLEVKTLAEPALLSGRDQAGPWVRQPAGTSVDLFLHLPERSPRLVLTGGGRAGGTARVVLDVEPDRGSMTEVWRGELSEDSVRSVDLANWAGTLVRLRLSAEGAGLAWRRLELQGQRVAPRASAAPQEPKATGEGQARPNLLLYVIDTLRADHTSLYGYHRRTTPRLEALAGEGIVFDPAWANTSWTRPGTATLLTGALPSVHGAMNTLNLLSPDVQLLSQTLKAAGYATHALVTNPNLRGRLGSGPGLGRVPLHRPGAGVHRLVGGHQS